MGCLGPELNDCYECIEHAYMDENGYCLCDGGYTGEDCSELEMQAYQGICHPYCVGGCSGPNSNDCED